MEPESSSPYPQVTAIRPYPEPTQSGPHHPYHVSTYNSMVFCLIQFRNVLRVRELHSCGLLRGE